MGMTCPGPGDLLIELASRLDARGYAFLCPTPESHARLFARDTVVTGRTPEDFFGWSLRVSREDVSQFLDEDLVDDLLRENLIIETEQGLQSSIRFSTLYMSSFIKRANGHLYVHSSYPTTASNSVFFGPDTYFFLDFILEAFPGLQTTPKCVVDVACGAGAGAIAVQTMPRMTDRRVYGLDLNPDALHLARVNAKIAHVDIEFMESDLFSAVSHRQDIDLILTNPPYIASSVDTPMYSAGGELEGLSLPLRIVEESIAILAPGGSLMLYTGVPIPASRPGHDPLLHRLRGLQNAHITSYKIIQPDIFGEELSHQVYSTVGRIQAVGAVIQKTRSLRTID